MSGFGFTKFPRMWQQQLRKVKARGTTYDVALWILDKARWAEWVTVTNSGLNINRKTKYRALKQLRAAGLIIMEPQGRKSPRVKAVFKE